MVRKFILLIAISSVVGCTNTNDEFLGEAEQLKSDNDSLKKELQKRDSLENSFNTNISLLTNNFNKIDSTKKAVQSALGKKNLSKSEKKAILQQMESIKSLINNTDSLMDSLSFSNSIGGFGEIVDMMLNQIEQKKTEVVSLKTELANTDQAFEDFDYHLELLSTVTNEQAEVIKAQEAKLNECWYVTGSYKDLKNKEIIGREKGFFKLGRKLQGEVDKTLFTKVDKREFTNLKLNGKKVKIATSHPEGSYKEKFMDNQYELIISNAGKFWSTSRHLVVVVD